MDIAPINNTNFKGQFKKTPALNTLLKNSNNETLTKFSEVVKKVYKVKDNKTFVVGSFIDYSKNTSNGERFYEYFLKQKDSSETKLICSYNFLAKPYNDLKSLTEKHSAALNSFINKLTEMYPEKEPRSKASIIFEIEDYLA